jgi:hypothetical protein
MKRTIMFFGIAFLFIGCSTKKKKSNDSLDYLALKTEAKSLENSSSSSYNTTSNWTLSNNKDPMGEEQSYYLKSETVGSFDYLDFPYKDVSSNVMIGCDNSGIWAYFWFNKFNLNGGKSDWIDNTVTYHFRIKFDQTVKPITMNQDMDNNHFLRIYYDSWFINNLKRANNIMLELDWYNNGKVHFKYDVSGFNKAYKKLIHKCRD